ncbi:MAG: cytoplasmic protein, partial [Marinilabiliales bacterium]
MMDFNQLIQNIQNISDALFKSASKSVNIHLSLRNLYVGYYIVEFEQNGSDRAKYGEKLLEEISKEINIKDLTASELSRCRQLYSVYQSILGTVSQKFLSDFSPK